MRKRAIFIAAGWTAAAFLAAGHAAELSIQDRSLTAAPEAASTIVVFNENDGDSADLARFYAEQRMIPKERVVGLSCPVKEEISREEYDRDIAEPLRRLFQRKGWWTMRAADHPLGRVEATSIRFVALIRGIPLKIAQTAAYEGDKPSGPPLIAARNDASVDAEIAALGFFSSSISGAISNPYYRSFARIADANFPALLLVARLDAATPRTVRRMITDSIAAEREGLRGFAYIDSRGIKDGGLAEGDTWLLKTADDARRRGTPVILDVGEGMFPVGYPMRRAALYFGWYSGDVAGPMAQDENCFIRGAVAVHIHSFSAATMRDPKRFWAAPLVGAGAAATLGNVYEPYLSLTPNLDIFHQRLRVGFTLAESAWSAQRALSWMTTVIGDPIYRPFKIDMEIGARGKTEWDAYRDGAKVWMEDREKGAAALKTAGRRTRSGIPLEGLGLLQLSADQSVAAIESFNEARRIYRDPDDILRVSIHEILQLRAQQKVPEALALTRQQIGAFPKAGAAELLRGFEREMAPPPAPTVPPK